jgi:hypothetical protein
MLAHVLEPIGVRAICLPVGDPPEGVLEDLALGVGDVVCISALPPFALLSARTLSKKLRERFPNLTILLGLWGATGENDYTDRLQKAFDVEVVRTLAEATAVVEGLQAASLQSTGLLSSR